MVVGCWLVVKLETKMEDRIGARYCTVHTHDQTILGRFFHMYGEKREGLEFIGYNAFDLCVSMSCSRSWEFWWNFQCL